MKHILKGTLLALCGGCLYILLEWIWRGYSHWTMGILGGICFALIGLLNETSARQTPLLWQGAIGSACIITPLEFLTGCIVNLWLGWEIWDYTALPCNLLGQVCLPFALLWVPVAMAAVLLDDGLRWHFFGEEPPHYTLIAPRKTPT